MQIVMEYSEGDGCTYHCTNTHPIEYESPEAALCDFEIAIKAAGMERFTFAGMEFWGDTFHEYAGWGTKREYVAPDFLTVDEWFKRK